MNEFFKSHKELNENDFTQLWENGLFVFDTSVLLDLYRLPENAKEDLLNIMLDKKINNRIWLPFQASLEFTHNRIDAISDQKNKFNEVKSIIKESIDDIKAIHQTLNDKLIKLQLKKRHSVINSEEFINENLFKDSFSNLNKFLKKLEQLDSKQPDVTDKDLLKSKITNIFNDKIGVGFNKQELESIYEEGITRYKDKIPPGYKDSDKQGFYLNDDKKHVRQFGDLVLWKELINKAEKEKLEYIILITSDSKEDWWQEKRGKKLGPRYELLNEIYFKAQNLKVFHMYDTSNFMQYSKQYLNINIKEQSIKESKDLIEFSKFELKNTNSINGLILLKQVINEICFKLSIRMKYLQGFAENLYIMLPEQKFYFIILEILSNVKNHSEDKSVSVRVFKAREYYVIKFRNSINKQITLDLDESRGKGINLIRSIINQKYGYVETDFQENFFQIKLFIKSKYCSTPIRAII